MKPITLSSDDHGYFFISHQGKLYLPHGEIPFGAANQFNLANKSAQKLGTLNDKIAWLICENRKNDMANIRSLLSIETECTFLMAGKAVQLAEFYRSHHFCGYCGHIMHKSENEWCCLCSHCNQRYYPQISPSIIVAIQRDNKILLAKHRRHQQDNLYTVLAGFTEVGETIETTVKREVFEETNIHIKNIRYVGSQPWPFPNSMMLAFLAEYDNGDINIDQNELIEANWFEFDQLPRIPEYGTIARRLIEDTVSLCRFALN